MSLAKASADATVVVRELVNRFHMYHEKTPRLELLKIDAEELVKPSARPARSSYLDRQSAEVRWLPLPYHWIWDASNLNRKLIEFNKAYRGVLAACNWRTCEVIKPAWRVNGSRFVPLINKIIGRRKGKEVSL